MRSHWIISAAISSFIGLIIIVPVALRSNKIANLFIQPESIIAFSVFLAGFAISLLGISKDVALSSSVERAQKPYFSTMVVSSFLAIFLAVGTVSSVGQLPAGTFVSADDAIKYLEKNSGMKFSASEEKFGIDGGELSQADYVEYVNKLYDSLAASKMETSRGLFMLINWTAAFCFVALANLFAATLVKMWKQ